MSSLKNSVKNRKAHRERHQPDFRAHLGILQKKKDYRLQAKDKNEKRQTLKQLRQRALERNPDEFYFPMINAKLHDGVHREKLKNEDLTEAQMKLMQTQDVKYVTHKRSVESKKIDKLKAQLHLLAVQGKSQNQHTFFVDTKKEAKKFDVVKHLDTHPDLLQLAYNRPRMSDLQNVVLPPPETAKSLALEHRRSYKMLGKRIEREKELLVIQQKMEVKKHLQSKNESKRTRVKAESKTSAAVYRWRQQRKK